MHHCTRIRDCCIYRARQILRIYLFEDNIQNMLEELLSIELILFRKGLSGISSVEYIILDVFGDEGWGEMSRNGSLMELQC